MPDSPARHLWDAFPLEQTPTPSASATATPRVLTGPGYEITYPPIATAVPASPVPARIDDVALVAWLPLAAVIVIALLAAGWRLLVWHDERTPISLHPPPTEEARMTAEPQQQHPPEERDEPVVRHRDAGDGQFITAADAAAHPDTTVRETAGPTAREVASAARLLQAALIRADGFDVSDHVQAGGTAGDLLRLANAASAVVRAGVAAA